MYLFKVTGWARPDKSGNPIEKFITGIKSETVIAKFITLDKCRKYLRIV